MGVQGGRRDKTGYYQSRKLNSTTHPGPTPDLKIQTYTPGKRPT